MLRYYSGQRTHNFNDTINKQNNNRCFIYNHDRVRIPYCVHKKSIYTHVNMKYLCKKISYKLQLCSNNIKITDKGVQVMTETGTMSAKGSIVTNCGSLLYTWVTKEIPFRLCKVFLSVSIVWLSVHGFAYV
jgi:hypothetical protein